MDSLLSPCDDTVRHGKAIPRPPGQGPSWAPRRCASSWPRSLAPLPVTFSITSCASLEPLLAASPPWPELMLPSLTRPHSPTGAAFREGHLETDLQMQVEFYFSQAKQEKKKESVRGTIPKPPQPPLED